MNYSKNDKLIEYVNCNLCNSNSTKSIMNVDGYNIVKCKECGLVYVNPRLKQKKLHEIYKKDYFSNSAFKFKKLGLYGYEKYLEEEDYIKATFNERLKIINSYSKKARLLDIGCALGFFLEIARNDGWNAQGLEIAKFAYEYATNKLELPVMNKTLEEAKFKSDSFDVVTIFDVIEHLPNPNGTIKEIRRILKPNGLIAITTPNIGSIPAKLLGKNWEEIKRVREHIYFFSENTLKKMLEVNKFKVLKTESAGRFFSVKSAIDRGKLVNKTAFTIIEKFVDILNLNDKRIYIDPHYKITMYAKKI